MRYEPPINRARPNVRRATLSSAVLLLLAIVLGALIASGASASSRAHLAVKSAGLDGQSVPALLGDPGIESSVDSDSPGVAEAFPFVARSSGSAGAASVYLDPQSSASTVLVGLYADSDGQPGSLLTVGTISSPTAGAWDSVALDPASVVEGDTYWISVLGVGGTIVFRDDNAGWCSSVTSAQSDLSSLPQAWSSGTSWPTCAISAYVTGSSSSTSVVSAPTNTAAPTISGTPQQGDTLTTSEGSWANSPTGFAYQWQDCDASGANCVDIADATSQSYEAASSDVGSTLEVVVSATNAGGSTSISTAAVGPVTPPAPQNTALPVISGTPQQGQTLTVDNGTWTENPTSYGYQWQDCDASGANCVNIADATSQSYEAASSDVGSTLEVVVSATNAGGSTSQSSAPTGVLVSAYSFDDEFNANSVDLTNWNVLDQQGDTSNSELECYLPSQVAESGGYLSETAVYDAGGITCPAGTPLSSNPLYYESGDIEMKSANFTYGTVVVRAQLSGASTWPAIWLLGAACQTSSTAPYTSLSGDPSSQTGYYCPWPADSSDAAEIDLAEYGNTSTPSENVYNSSGGIDQPCTADIGSNDSSGYNTYELDWEPGSIVFKVNGVTTNCGLTGSGVPSQPMFLIIDTAICTASSCGTPSGSDLPQSTSVDYARITSATMPVNSAVPTISGSAQVGALLTASTGSWTNSPSSYTYQWQQDDTTDIVGATSSTYTPVAGDAGHTLDVIVTAHNGTTAAGSQASPATTTVTASD